ncbi:hypothetical protein ADIS_0768 [Lunatimonas lonarensis]|uniref:Uncharacterized protein n=1 Tax=Lunatimonas lonarensis TaxID=1232681 RepID=R7ZXI4_9BACT|nr:hypothetical protein ADIS_0768 [Lunatimonas lonarensis]
MFEKHFKEAATKLKKWGGIERLWLLGQGYVVDKVKDVLHSDHDKRHYGINDRMYESHILFRTAGIFRLIQTVLQ